MSDFIRADLLAEVEEALRRIDNVEWRLSDWLIKTELEDAKRALYRLREKLEEVGA